MTALLIAGKSEKKLVAEGKKTITIREGHRDYQVGDRLMLGCHLLSWAVLTKVVFVRHCLAKEVTEDEYRAGGYASLEDMIYDLRRFYPNLDAFSPVTVIRWKDDVAGKLVKTSQNFR
jgi:hypothetical protein